MKRISPQKRNQLILASLAILVVVAGLWYGLVGSQRAGLVTLDARRKGDELKLAQIQDTIKNSKGIEEELLVVSNRLAFQEEDMASGDLYSSMVSTIRRFKQPYRVDIPQFTSGGAAADVNLLLKFPYKQVTVTVSGTAYYHDLGKFAADFENQFPTSRLLNLELTPASTSNPEEKEKLTFKMDIVSLVKPGAARRATTP